MHRTLQRIEAFVLSVCDVIAGIPLEVWGFILSGFTLVVVLVQLLVMRRQSATMDRQLEVMRKQDEILDRRADFCLFVTYDEQKLRLQFVIQNTGNKTARDFYWHLFVPIIAQDQVFNAPSGLDLPRHPTEYHGYPHHHYESLINLPLYPTRLTSIGFLRFNHEPPIGDYKFFWKVVSEDGIVPSGDLAEVSLTIPPTARLPQTSPQN